MLINPQEFDRSQREQLRKRFDANNTAMLERELTQVRTRVYTEFYAPTLARTFLPKATDISSSATTYSYKVYRPKGEVKLISAKGNDLPRLDLGAEELTGKVRMVGGSYGWDIIEMREAVRTGTPLSDMLARMAAEAIERGIDEMLAFGSLPDSLSAYPDIGCTGLINNAAIIGMGILAGSFWLGLTPPDPEDVMRELNALVIAPSAISKNVFKTTDLILPSLLFNYAEQTIYSPLTGESILSTFLKNNKSVKSVTPWWRLDGAGVGGAHRGIAYQKDAMTGEAIIPQEMEIMPPEWQQLELLNHVFARCGGVKVYQPLAFKYCDWAAA